VFGTRQYASAKHCDLNFVTANITGAGSLTKWLTSSTVKAQILFIQEHHMVGTELVEEHSIAGALQTQVDKAGYTRWFGKALPTGQGGTSGGVGFLWAKHASVTIPEELLLGRMAAMSCTTAFGSILLINIYGQTGATLAKSAAILHKAFAYAGSTNKPTIVAGDFNQPPHEVQAFLDTFHLPYDIRFTPHHTCRVASGATSTIDFFIIHIILSEVVGLPTLVQSHPLKTHTPVQLSLRQALIDTSVTVMQLQPRSSPCLVIGPHWPTGRFDKEWDPLVSQLDDFVTRNTLSKTSSPLRTATADQVDDITALIHTWAATSLTELAPACGMEKEPMREVTIRSTTARQALATKQSTRTQPSLAFHRLARALHTTNHPYTPERGREVAFQLKALQGISTTAWIDLHLTGWQTKQIVDRIRQHLSAISARHEAFTTNRTNLYGSTPLNRMGFLRLIDPLFIAWADLLQTYLHLEENGNIASKLEWALSGASWKWFLASALEGGAGLAHRLSKPTALQLHKIAVDGTQHPSSLLQDQVHMWSGYWKCGTTTAHIPDLADLDTEATNSHDFTSNLLRSASASFKPRTSVVDGISPRQFSLISDTGLEALSSILWICEKYCTFGNAITDLAVRLLLKTDGGRRPIALFRAMFRLYGKARKNALQTWEKRIGLGHFFNMAPTRHVTDSTYRSMLLRLLEPPLHHAELLWDVAKCFEHVKHTRPWNDTTQHGYPVAVLRCSLLAYTWARRLLWDNGICSPPMRPSRGIGAGSFSATFELKLYMINTITQFAAQWPHLSLSLHVDDLSLGLRHSSLHALLSELREAAAWLIYSFQNELGLPFSLATPSLWPAQNPSSRLSRAPLVSMPATQKLLPEG
jgi:hypothetical protein